MIRQWSFSLLWLTFFVNYFNYASGQTKDTSFRLLWYKGKKLSDSAVLIPTGQTITYKTNQGRIEVTTPSKQDVVARLKKEIDNGEQRKTSLSQMIINSPKGPQKAGLVYHVNKTLDAINSSYKELAESTIELVVEKNNRSANNQIPPHIQTAYQEVKDFVSNNSSINSVPSPPSMGFDYCYPCDEERQAAFKRDSIQFMAWFEQEKNNLEKAMKVLGYFANRKLQNLARDPEGEEIETEMFDAIEKIVGRMESKLLKTWNQYKGDVTKLPFLAQQLFNLIRQQQLMGLKGSPDFPGALQIAASCVEAGMNHLSQAKRDLDYKVLLNVRWIVALFRTAELLGMNSNQFSLALIDFLKINQFKVKVDARAKLNQEGTVIGVKMTGENIFGAVPDSNCVLKWTLLSPDIDYMKFKLEEATMKLPETTAEYTGTRNWKSYPADIKLDFCKEERDTFFLHGFIPADGKESWIAKGQRVEAGVVHGVYFGCFMDEERVREMANDPGLQARMEKQLQENYQKFMATYQGAKDPSKMTPAEIQKMNEAMLAAKDMMNNIQSVSPFSFLCKERLKNNQKTVFEGHVNGKEIGPDNPAIVEAILEITIEHDG